jgi:hypothetical protein
MTDNDIRPCGPIASATHCCEYHAIHSDDDVAAALTLIEQYGGIDGEHHKTWVIDQIARALLGDRYPQWVVEMKAGEDGPETYSWDEGIAP